MNRHQFPISVLPGKNELLTNFFLPKVGWLLFSIVIPLRTPPDGAIVKTRSTGRPLWAGRFLSCHRSPSEKGAITHHGINRTAQRVRRVETLPMALVWPAPTAYRWNLRWIDCSR